MLRTHLRRAGTTTLVLAAFVGTGDRAAAQSDLIDMTGEWTLTVSSPNGPGTREVVIEQVGDTIRGTIASSMAEGPFEGTVDQATGAVEFTAIIVMGGGNEFEIVYTATWRDGELVDGFMDIGDYGSGTFTGVRKEGGGQLPSSVR